MSSSEVGKDVVRFMMLTRRADAPLDFDFAKVVEASKDNPVFYVQYAHARIARCSARRPKPASIARRAGRPALLDDEELALVKLAAQFPRMVEGAAMAHEPHRIAFYLYDLAAAFHALWNRGNDDPARRFLLTMIHNFHARGWNSRGDRADHPQRSGVDGGGRGRGDALTMGDSQAAVGFDRLPWLADELQPRAKRSGRDVAAWAVAAHRRPLLATSYWMGANSVHEPPGTFGEPAPTPKTTVALPEPRPAQSIQPQVPPEVAPQLEPLVAPPIPVTDETATARPSRAPSRAPLTRTRAKPGTVRQAS